MADRFIVGDEAQVAEQIATYRDRFGIDHLLLRLQWPGVGQRAVLTAMEHVGRVIARLE